MNALRLSTTCHGDTATVIVAGELDIATTGRLCAHVAEVLAKSRWSLLVLEVGGLSFIGAAGLGALVAIQKHADGRHTALRLAGVTPGLMRLLKITRLDGRFTCVES